MNAGRNISSGQHWLQHDDDDEISLSLISWHEIYAVIAEQRRNYYVNAVTSFVELTDFSYLHNEIKIMQYRKLS